MKRFTLALGIAAMLAAPSAASAQVSAGDTNVPCSLFDFTGVTVLGCSGFWAGNLNTGGAGSNSTTAQNVALNALGVATPVTILEKFNLADPSSYVDFSTMLYGITVVGFHWGGGVFNNATNFPGAVIRDGSAFYKIDAGTTGIDKLYFSTIMSQSTSNAVLFLTGDEPDDPGGPTETVVPEPATMTLLATGLAGMAAARRRRKQA